MEFEKEKQSDSEYETTESESEEETIRQTNNKSNDKLITQDIRADKNWQKTRKKGDLACGYCGNYGHLAIKCRHKAAVSRKAWRNRTTPQQTNPPTFYNSGNKKESETIDNLVHGPEALTRRELHAKLQQSQQRVKELEEKLNGMEIKIARAVQEATLKTTLALTEKDRNNKN